MNRKLAASRARHLRDVALNERTVLDDGFRRSEETTSYRTPQRLDSMPLRFIRFTAVRDRTGLSRSTIWRLERQGEFPRHRRISSNAVGWLEQEVNEWVLARLKAG
jgi:prophage regulatory protein